MSRASVNKAIEVIKAGGASDTDIFHALWTACIFNWKEEVVELLKTPQGSALAASKRNACLRKAVGEGYHTVVAALLENQAVIDGTAADLKPLLVARINNDTEMIKLLLSKPSIANAPDTKAIMMLDV